LKEKASRILKKTFKKKEMHCNKNGSGGGGEVASRRGKPHHLNVFKGGGRRKKTGWGNRVHPDKRGAELGGVALS